MDASCIGDTYFGMRTHNSDDSEISLVKRFLFCENANYNALSDNNALY